MIPNTLKKSDIVQKRLIKDEYYYKHIFKKTEKIVCAVLYIFKTYSDTERQIALIREVEQTARMAHSTVLDSLHEPVYQAHDTVERAAHTLLTLESKLFLAQAAELISPDVLHVLHAEIEGVLRSVSRFIEEGIADTGATESLGYFATAPAASTPRLGTSTHRTTSSVRSSRTTTEGGVQKVKQGRRTHILDIITEQGEVAIKDISDIITDCSEKTIQRELNNLIKDNKIKKTGERRWSRYSVV